LNNNTDPMINLHVEHVQFGDCFIPHI